MREHASTARQTTTSQPLIETLDAVRDHLTQHALPALSAVTVSVYGTIHLQLHPDFQRQDSSTLAGALLPWADTLSNVTVEVWRVPSSTHVHLEVRGRLAGGARVEVYGAVEHTPRGVGGHLGPSDGETIPLDELRAATR